MNFCSSLGSGGKADNRIIHGEMLCRLQNVTNTSKYYRTQGVLHSPSTPGNCYQMAITQGLIEAQRVSFLPQSFGAGGTKSCTKFDYSYVDYCVPFFIQQTNSNINKIAVKSKLFSCSLRLGLSKWQHFPLWGGGEVTLSASSWRV